MDDQPSSCLRGSLTSAFLTSARLRAHMIGRCPSRSRPWDTAYSVRDGRVELGGHARRVTSVAPREVLLPLPDRELMEQADDGIQLGHRHIVMRVPGSLLRLG